MIPSHVHCNQFKMFNGLVFEFIVLLLVAKVTGKLLIDAKSGVFYNFWSISPHYGLFLISVFNYLRIDVINF